MKKVRFRFSAKVTQPSSGIKPRLSDGRARAWTRHVQSWTYLDFTRMRHLLSWVGLKDNLEFAKEERGVWGREGCLIPEVPVLRSDTRPGEVEPKPDASQG